MNIEENFIKEFKAYSEYKAHLMNGAPCTNNPCVGRLMSCLPTNEALRLENVMYAQSRYLLGLDICTGVNGSTKSTFASFLSAALPPMFQKVDINTYTEYCAVKGITEPYFSDLNKTVVKLQQRLSYKKRITGSDHSFIRDNNGNIMTRDIDIPQGSRVVLSHKSIHLPNFVKTEHGATRRVQVSEGFGYLDYVDTPSGRSYLYYIPKQYIYPCNLCCLVLSESRLTTRYYWGRKYLFNRGVPSAYLYVVPYDRRILKPSNVVFCLKDSDDFEKEIATLESCWQSGAGLDGSCRPPLLYPFDKLHLYSSMGYSDSGDCSLAYQTLPEKDHEPYTKLNVSLAEMQDAQSDEFAL